MSGKKKIIIVGVLFATIFVGGFFYFKNHNKKVELVLREEFSGDPISETVEKNVEKESASQKEAQAEKPVRDNTDGEIADKIAPKTETEKTPEIKNPSPEIIDRLVNFGFQKSAERKIDTLVIHSSYDAPGSDPYSVSGVIAEYKSYGVAPHYLIDRNGQVYRLVAEQNIAYHAGESEMPDGRTGVNAFSLGVEMLTTKTDKLTQEQYDSLNKLIAYAKEKYAVKNILGHSQIAPGRKDDPWNFEWGKIKK